MRASLSVDVLFRYLKTGVSHKQKPAIQRMNCE